MIKRIYKKNELIIKTLGIILFSNILFLRNASKLVWPAGTKNCGTANEDPSSS